MSLEIEKLDVRGKACPIPIVLIKRKLEGTKSGKILEVRGDCGPTLENIQRWTKHAGYEIIESAKIGNEFKIKIRRN